MGFGIDMAKAREIHKTNIRRARESKLAELDIQFQKLFGSILIDDLSTLKTINIKNNQIH